MNCKLVFERDNSQNSALKFVNLSPKPIPVFLLQLAFQRLLQNSNAPFFFQIGTLAQNFFLKILREPVFWHLQRITRFLSDDQPYDVAAQPLTRVETVYHRNLVVGSSGG
jgi:hypothetical protein